MIRLDERIFSITLEMIARGLALDRSGDRKFLSAAERLRATLQGDTDIRIPAEIDADELERRRFVERLSEILQRYRRDKDGAGRQGGDAAMTAALWAKRRGSTIGRMHAGGRIDDRQLKAATEIAAGADGLIASAVGKASSLEGKIGGAAQPGSARPGAYVDVLAQVERYRAWCAQCAGTFGREALRAVLDVVVAGKPLRDTEREWRMRNGSLADLLGDSLDLWAER
jgi:hypothetical protein